MDYIVTDNVGLLKNKIMSQNTIVCLVVLSLLFYLTSCGTVKTAQQSHEPDTVTVTAEDREIFVVYARDAIPNEDGTWNPIDSGRLTY